MNLLSTALTFHPHTENEGTKTLNYLNILTVHQKNRLLLNTRSKLTD